MSCNPERSRIGVHHSETIQVATCRVEFGGEAERPGGEQADLTATFVVRRPAKSGGP